MLVTGNKGQVMLLGQGGNPDIIVRKGPAFAREVFFDLPILASGFQITREYRIGQGKFFDAVHIGAGAA